MPDRETKPRVGGGGAATSGGILFQQQIGAAIAVQLLAGKRLDHRLNLGEAKPLWVRFETEAPVDDILVATTIGGYVAIQAKTNVSLSQDPKSPFGKTVAQFVRHWLACENGDGSQNWNRPLDPAKDRLVLATGLQSSLSVRVDLAAALKLRSQPGEGDLTDAQTRAFAEFENCVKQTWAGATSAPLPENAAGILAKFITILTVDPAGSDRGSTLADLEGAVASRDAKEIALHAIQSVSAELMSSRGGVDLTVLRQMLRTRGVPLLASPDFRSDIDALKAHSVSVAESLSKYEVIEAAAGHPVSINRDCQQSLLEAAIAGSLLIVGEPGAGKSGVLNMLARDLRAIGKDVLELAVDRFSVETLEGLSQDLRLSHSLPEVLEAWDGDDAGWLIIDALDATRGGKGEGVFRTLIERVLASEGRWKIVASIRTFDLRMGQQFRSLFSGEPPVKELQESGFSAVRHVLIPNWSQGEFGRLLAATPALDAALANAPPALRELAIVPFNTRLISDLIKQGLVTADFSHIASQAELLQLYWNRRVESHGTPGRACIERTVHEMVAARALRAPTGAVAQNDAATVDALAREGVITLVDNGRWVQFRHHLLFDFAAARVLLDPSDIISGRTKFPKEDARGLMLAPALSFLLREIWDRDVARADFWTAAATILADAENDPVIRSATGRNCAEYPVAPSDIETLAKRVVQNDKRAAQALIHTGGALAVRLEDNRDTTIVPWVALLYLVSENVKPVAGTYRFLLYRLLSGELDSDLRNQLGHSARALLDFGFSSNNPRHYTPNAIAFVAKTFDTNPAEAKAALQRIFEPQRLLVYGVDEVPALTREIKYIASVDPEFTVEIYRATYAFHVIDDRPTRMNDSQIMGLTSNARQDYDMARYSLVEFFPTFLAEHPTSAVTAVIDALEGYVAREHPIPAQLTDITLDVAGRHVRLREDWSHIWAHDPNNVYGHDADALVVKLSEFLRSADEEIAVAIADHIVATSSLALLWSRLFMVGATRPGPFLDMLVPIACAEPFLMSTDTRKDAIDVIARGYTILAEQTRIDFETTVLGWSFGDYKYPIEAREGFLRRLFVAIGGEHLTIPAAKEFAVRESKNEEDPNERLFVVRTSSRPSSPYDWIEGLDLELPANKDLISLIDNTKSTLGIEAGEKREPAEYHLSVQALRNLADNLAPSAQNPLLVNYAEGIIGQGLGALIDRKMVPSREDIAGTTTFLDLIAIGEKSEGPTVEEDTEGEFERSPSWGSPAPRLEAAEAALDLILQREDLYPVLEPAIDKFLRDPHPAVRLQAALRLLRFWDIDRSGFWSKLRNFLATEANLGVLDHVIGGVLGRIIHADPEKLEDLICLLLTRFPEEPERQARLRRKISYLVAILWVTHDRHVARTILDQWVADTAKFHSELSATIMRDAYVAGLTGDEGRLDEGLRHRAFKLAHEIVDAAGTALEAYAAKDEHTEDERTLATEQASLIDTVCREMYFSIGHSNDRLKPSIDPEKLAAFFAQAEPVLKRIGDCGSPHTIYYLLQLLELLIPTDAVRSFDLTANGIRNGGRIFGYQFESLGADLMVRMVGVFLADHKELFEDDGRRAALIDCLEIFMEAGWPAARRLLYRLPELVQ